MARGRKEHIAGARVRTGCRGEECRLRRARAASLRTVRYRVCCEWYVVSSLSRLVRPTRSEKKGARSSCSSCLCVAFSQIVTDVFVFTGQERRSRSRVFARWSFRRHRSSDRGTTLLPSRRYLIPERRTEKDISRVSFVCVEKVAKMTGRRRMLVTALLLAYAVFESHQVEERGEFCVLFRVLFDMIVCERARYATRARHRKNDNAVETRYGTVTREIVPRERSAVTATRRAIKSYYIYRRGKTTTSPREMLKSAKLVDAFYRPEPSCVPSSDDNRRDPPPHRSSWPRSSSWQRRGFVYARCGLRLAALVVRWIGFRT